VDNQEVDWRGESAFRYNGKYEKKFVRVNPNKYLLFSQAKIAFICFFMSPIVKALR
jgi:hypothetical protein